MWGQARTTAAARQQSGMRLDHVPAEPGEGEQLVADAGFLRHRAKSADTARTEFVKTDDAASKETGQVAGSLKGFKSGPAFTTFMTRWRGQVDPVENLLKNDVAGALRTNADEYAAHEQQEKARHIAERRCRPGCPRTRDPRTDRSALRGRGALGAHQVGIGLKASLCCQVFPAPAVVRAGEVCSRLARTPAPVPATPTGALATTVNTEPASFE